MKRSLFLLIQGLLLTKSYFAQFNNIYFENQGLSSSTVSIKENPITGNFHIPCFYYTTSENSQELGFLTISNVGNFNSLTPFTTIPSSGLYGAKTGFFTTEDSGFVYSAGINGPYIRRVNSNLELLWENYDSTGAPNHFWGGGELSNGDLVLGLSIQGTPWNILKMRRYSAQGTLLANFDVELDYDYGYPTSFITEDSLIYISFHRLLMNNYRRNYIVCYNAITGEEIWETHQIENSVALGFTEGYLCMSETGQLRMAFVEQTYLDFPNTFYAYYDGIIKVANINKELGFITEEFVLSEEEPAVYVLDVVSNNDGGFSLIAFSPFPNQTYTYPYGIAKVSENFEIEWRVYFPPPTYTPNNDAFSYLSEIEATSDDGLVAVGLATEYSDDGMSSFQHPWVLKVDACGNQVVSDCTLSGLAELGESKQLAVYPNPARDRIFLKAEDAIQHATIFDMSGKIVHNESFSGALEQTLFVDHLQQGLYLVQVTTSAGVVSKRIIIGN